MKSRFLISFKITGLLTGMLTWGWRGMIIGFLLGYLLDKKLNSYLDKAPKAPYGKRYRSKDESLFFQITFQMLGYLAKADGQVSQQEIHATEYIMSSMALSADERLAAIEAFNTGKNQPELPYSLISRFKKRFKQRTGKKMEWLHYQFQLLYAEGRADTQLVETLGMAAFHAGINPEQFQTIRQQYRKAWQDNSRQYTSGRDEHKHEHRNEQQRWHQDKTSNQQRERQEWGSHSGYRQHHRSNAYTSFGQELNAAYQLLGVTPDCDPASMKKAYRQKISKVHPDKLAGKNASPSEQARAKELSQQLQAAYQLIKKSRKTF